MIPPYSFENIKDIITSTQGFKIDDKMKLNELKNQLEKYNLIRSIDLNRWERKRDKMIDGIRAKTKKSPRII